MSKRIVISGYYGFGNTGDEAVLSGILTTLRELAVDAEITVLSVDPERTQRQHGVNAVHRFKLLPMVLAIAKADLFISGGGSLLQDVTSTRSVYYYLFLLRLAQFMHKKTMIYAQGIGPLQKENTRRAVAKALGKVDVITVRDTDSRELLESIGISGQIYVCADPAFLVEPDLLAADRRIADLSLRGMEIMGVSLRPWPNTSEWLPEVAEGIRLAADEIGVDVMMIPMQESDDLGVCEAAGTGRVVRTGENVQLTKGLIARCGLVVGMRLHSLIFAASVGVPFVPISYDPKITSFAELVGQPSGLDVRSLSADVVKQSILSAWSNRKQRTELLQAKAAELREAVLSCGKILDNLIS